MMLVTKYSFQKGLSPIIVIVILAVLGISVFIIYNNQKPSSNNNQQIQTNSQTDQSLEKIEASNYTFYYPKGYVSSSKKPQQTTVLYYTSTDNISANVGISLAIQQLQKRITNPSPEFCKEAAQIQAKNTSAVVVQAKPLDYKESHGCEFIIAAKNTKDEAIIHQKQLWYKEKQDFSIYAVHTLYAGSMPQEEKDSLDQAVSQFAIK